MAWAMSSISASVPSSTFCGSYNVEALMRSTFGHGSMRMRWG